MDSRLDQLKELFLAIEPPAQSNLNDADTDTEKKPFIQCYKYLYQQIFNKKTSSVDTLFTLSTEYLRIPIDQGFTFSESLLQAHRLKNASTKDLAKYFSAINVENKFKNFINALNLNNSQDREIVKCLLYLFFDESLAAPELAALYFFDKQLLSQLNLKEKIIYFNLLQEIFCQHPKRKFHPGVQQFVRCYPHKSFPLPIETFPNCSSLKLGSYGSWVKSIFEKLATTSNASSQPESKNTESEFSSEELRAAYELATLSRQNLPFPVTQA